MHSQEVKFASASEARFPSVACTARGIDFAVAGAPAEQVGVALLRPAAAQSEISDAREVLTLRLTIPAGGRLEVSLPPREDVPTRAARPHED